MARRSPRPAPKRLGEKLLQIRAALGLSQAGMVRQLDYTESALRPAQLSNFEQGKREPPVMLILAYARAVRIPMELLVDDRLELPEILPASRRERMDYVKRLYE